MLDEIYLKLSTTIMQRRSEWAYWCTNVYNNGFQQPLHCCKSSKTISYN